MAAHAPSEDRFTETFTKTRGEMAFFAARFVLVKVSVILVRIPEQTGQSKRSDAGFSAFTLS